MPTVILSPNTDGAFSVNGSFLSVVKKSGTISVPLGTAPSFISFFPAEKDRLPVFALLEYNGTLLKCSESRAELMRWSESVYELFVFSDKKPPCIPPIVTSESQWSNGFAGIAGGYFIFQSKEGTRYFNGFTVNNFRILSDKFVLLENNSALTVLSRDMNPVFPPVFGAEYTFDSKTLTITFSPGKMDYFKVTQVFSITDMRLLSSSCRCESVPPHSFRCFCQAVRLNLKECAEKFLTESLKNDMSFEEIRAFLGTFDETDLPRQVYTDRENTVALRYMLDENNFHYMCFSFTADKNGLIDDIIQL